MNKKNEPLSLISAKFMVKKICKERGIPIYKLEKECGFANGYIGQLKKDLPFDRIVKIAEFLGVSTTYLTTGALTSSEFTKNSQDLSRTKFYDSLYTYGYEITELESGKIEVYNHRKGWVEYFDNDELELLRENINTFIDYTANKFFSDKHEARLKRELVHNDNLELNAAHEIKNSSIDEKKHDDDIMDSDNF